MQIKLFDLGLQDFQTTLDFQQQVFSQVKDKEIYSALILCRHTPVITLGRNAKEGDILVNKDRLSELNIKSYKIKRGGKVTYHGPGQLCIYPIINLTYFKKDINWFLRSLESLIIAVLADFSIKAMIRPTLTGIWMPDDKTGGRWQKIASIGIAIRHWISFHGISLNIKKDDLANFSLIRPCGLDIIMTSMETILGEKIGFNEFKKALIRRWNETGNFTRIG